MAAKRRPRIPGAEFTIHDSALLKRKGKIRWNYKIQDEGVDCHAVAVHWHLRNPGIIFHPELKGRWMRECLAHESFHLVYPCANENLCDEVGLKASAYKHSFDISLRRVILEVCPWMRPEFAMQFADDVAALIEIPQIKERWND